MKRGKAATVQTAATKFDKAARSARFAVEDRERRGVGVSTAHRIMRSGLPIEVSDEGREKGKAGQRVAQAPLDRLKSRGLISKRQYDAGDQFRMDHYAAGLMTSGSMPLEPSAGTVVRAPAYSISDRAASALTRFNDAQRKLTSPKLRGIVSAVLWPNELDHTLAAIGASLFNRSGRAGEVSALTALIIALDLLADHYWPRGKPKEIQSWRA